MKRLVNITEIITKLVEVEADTAEEAKAIAEQLWQDADPTCDMTVDVDCNIEFDDVTPE